MLEMVVPGQVILGEMASLHCLYDMEGEELYSVKWYKNGHEFFRYIPGTLLFVITDHHILLQVTESRGSPPSVCRV